MKIWQPTGLPDTAYVKLKWTTFIRETSTAVALDDWYVTGNSCVDPGGPDASSQPYLWDQWAALYQEYCCMASKITVRYVSTESSTQRILMGPSTSTSLPTYTDAMWEPYWKKRMYGSGAIQQPIKTISMYRTTKKVLQKGGSTTSDEDYWSTTSTGPVFVWYWRLFNQLYSGSNFTGVRLYDITVIYYVKFRKRVYNGPS